MEILVDRGSFIFRSFVRSFVGLHSNKSGARGEEDDAWRWAPQGQVLRTNIHNSIYNKSLFVHIRNPYRVRIRCKSRREAAWIQHLEA